MSDLLEVMGLDKVLDNGEFVAMLMTLKPDAFLCFLGATIDRYEDEHEGFRADEAIYKLSVLSQMAHERYKRT